MKRNVTAIGFGLALLIFAVFTVSSYLSMAELTTIGKLRSRAFSAIERLGSLSAQIASAEIDKNNYIITGEEDYLVPYYDGALRTVDGELEGLGKLFADKPDQQQRLDILEPLIRRRFANFRESIELRKKSGLNAVVQSGLITEGREIHNAVNDVINRMFKEEEASLAHLGFLTMENAKGLMSKQLLGTLLSFTILYGIFYMLNREMHERRRAEEALQKANKDLSSYVNELEQRNREIELLSEMDSLLQASATFEEAHTVIAKFVQDIFSKESGAVYLLNEPKNTLEAIVSWGDIKPGEQVMGTDECWALRLGRIHQVDATRPEVICHHIKHVLDAAYLCVPMMAQNETIGLLHLLFDSNWFSYSEEVRKHIIENKRRLALTVAESIALLLANFRLREILYSQSIHDSLTGLFNRRHMEQLLERELHRVSRKGYPLGIIMLDIDHFKRFNDTFGHEAGDMLLRELSACLQRGIREEDFACRYGGEEFVIILPETSLENTRQRAEQLRKEAGHTTIIYRGKSLDAITVSMGVAAFPEHGTTADELLRAADTALYRAKEEGRDRVVAL